MNRLLCLVFSVIILLGLSGYSYAGEWCGCGRVAGGSNCVTYPQTVTTYAVPAPSTVTYVYNPWFVPAPAVYVTYPVPVVQTVWVPTVQYVATPQVTYQRYHIYKY